MREIEQACAAESQGYCARYPHPPTRHKARATWQPESPATRESGLRRGLCARPAPHLPRISTGILCYFHGFLEEGEQLMHVGYGKNYARRAEFHPVELHSE